MLTAVISSLDYCYSDICVLTFVVDWVCCFFLQLLPDLEYADNMTVLCVNNGPRIMNHKQWDLRAFLQRVTALNQ